MKKTIRILFYGDVMLGRAVGLTFQQFNNFDPLIEDSMTAQQYLDSIIQNKEELTIIRRMNQNNASYLIPNSLQTNDLNEDLRILNIECAPTITVPIDKIPSNIPNQKGIRYHFNLNNFPLVFPINTYNKQKAVFNLANNHALDMGGNAANESLILKNNYNIIGFDYGNDVYKPCIISRNDCNIIVFGFGTGCSGIPDDWKSNNNQIGVAYLPPITNLENVNKAFEIISSVVNYHIRNINSDLPLIKILSIHWGPNWALELREIDGIYYRKILAHRIIDELNFHVIYGTSSHHVRGLENYKGSLIMYGIGDFINDYENIPLPDNFKYSKLGGIFVVDIEINNKLNATLTEIVPVKMNKLRVDTNVSKEEVNDFVRTINYWTSNDVTNGTEIQLTIDTLLKS